MYGSKPLSMGERVKGNVTQGSINSRTVIQHDRIVLVVKVVECTAPVPLTISYRLHEEGV